MAYLEADSIPDAFEAGMAGLLPPIFEWVELEVRAFPVMGAGAVLGEGGEGRTFL